MVNETNKSWTGNIHLGSKVDIDVVLKQLCKAFNSSPYFQHNGMTMRVIEGQIEGYIEMQPYMIGNVAFQILHGGVAATLLDSIGGIVAMGELYKRAPAEQLVDTIKKSPDWRLLICGLIIWLRAVDSILLPVLKRSD